MQADFWLELSRERLENARERLTTCESVVGGFNLLVDRSKQIKPKELEQLIEAAGIKPALDPSICSAEASRQTAILDRRGFVESLVTCIASGHSLELPISRREVFDWLNSRWGESSDERVGGQPAHMALAACNLVSKVVLVGWPIPKSYVRLLPRIDNIYLMVSEGNELRVKSIRECTDLSGHNYANWAIDFPEGLEIRIGRSKVKCPRAGRFIANWFPREWWMSPGTSDNLSRSVIQTTHAFLSGCQSLCPEMDAKGLWRRQVSEFAATIRTLRSRTACRAVHYEMGTMRGPLLKKVIEEVFPVVDSVGCNGEELAEILRAIGDKKLASQITAESIEDVYRGASHVVRHCGLRRLHVHTWKFHVSISQGGADNHVVERDALLFGAVMGAAKTYTVEYIQDSHIEQGLNTPFSDSGIKLVKDLHENPKAVGECIGDGRFQTACDTVVSIVPGRVKPGLDSTVGLGDTLSSMAFLAAAG